jgi:hypothetical protein
MRVKARLDSVFISLWLSIGGVGWFSFLTLWTNDTEHSQANPSTPDRTGSTRESGEIASLSKGMFLCTSSPLLLSTRNRSKKWNPTSTRPRGLFQNLASCGEFIGASTIIQGVLTVASATTLLRSSGGVV